MNVEISITTELAPLYLQLGLHLRILELPTSESGKEPLIKRNRQIFKVGTTQERKFGSPKSTKWKIIACTPDRVLKNEKGSLGISGFAHKGKRKHERAFLVFVAGELVGAAKGPPFSALGQLFARRAVVYEMWCVGVRIFVVNGCN